MNNSIRKLYFSTIGGLVIIMSALNYWAYQFHWYWEFWWFDMIMHTLGGVFVGSFFLWEYFFRKPSAEAANAPKKSFVLALSLLAVLVIGVGWELFEFSIDKFVSFSRHDPVDTASDLFLDVLGSVLAVFLFFIMYNKNNKLKK